MPVRRCGRPRRFQCRIFIDGAVTILTLDFHRAHHFGLDVAVAVIVLRVMAIDALHADVDVNRLQMHGLLPFVGIVVVDDLFVLVEQVALAVARIYAAEIPAVAVIVGELRILQLRIEQRDVAHEIDVAPFAANRRFFGIAVENLALFGVGRIFLFLRPHERRVGLVIPHRVADHRIDEHVRLMHVADHALAGRNLAREFVLERMAGFVAAEWSDRSAATCRYCRIARTARSGTDHGRSRTRRGSPNSRTNDSRQDCRWCPSAR